MDEVGLRTHVLTLSGQVAPIWLEPGFGVAVSQVVNDEYATLQAKYPERFVGGGGRRVCAICTRRFSYGHHYNNQSPYFSGIFDRFPSIPWIFFHGGGTVPYLGGRWDHGYKLGFTGTKGLERAPSEYLASLYFDTLVYNPETLRFLVNYIGPDHVLMGTDYPYELMADPDPVGTVYGIPNLGNDDRTKILGGNAAGLFDL